MNFIATNIPDVILIEPQVFEDDRGAFAETWHARKFSAAGIDANFVQDNHSRSVKWTLRGLHYQIRQPQGKLVRVAVGTVFDVAVDLRRDSPTFGRWVGVSLSSKKCQLMWIPPGFAHGFFVTSDYAEVEYKCTDYYAPGFERTIVWNDPDLAITWSLPDDVPPLLSVKDKAGLAFADSEYYS